MQRSDRASPYLFARVIVAAVSTLLLMGFGPRDALWALNGRWIGPDLSLAVNAHTLQANADEKRPFHWEPLFLLDVSGRLVTFAIGQRGFVALISEDGKQIIVTPFGGQRSVILDRYR
jgi:hypothetical protein